MVPYLIAVNYAEGSKDRVKYHTATKLERTSQNRRYKRLLPAAHHMAYKDRKGSAAKYPCRHGPHLGNRGELMLTLDMYRYLDMKLLWAGAENLVVLLSHGLKSLGYWEPFGHLCPISSFSSFVWPVLDICCQIQNEPIFQVAKKYGGTQDEKKPDQISPCYPKCFWELYMRGWSQTEPRE